MAITCAVKPGSGGSIGSQQDGADVLVAIGHPVGGEQVLVLPRDRALEAHHGVDPGGVLRLDQEFRIGAVLAAAIGDPVVDHHDLAVVAQVDPPVEARSSGLPIGSARGQPHAGRAPSLPRAAT